MRPLSVVVALALLCAVSSTCISGQLSRKCSVARVAGSAYVSPSSSGSAPPLPPLFESTSVPAASAATATVLVGPYGAAYSSSRHTLYFSESARHVVRSLDTVTGTHGLPSCGAVDRACLVTAVTDARFAPLARHCQCGPVAAPSWAA